MLGSLNSATGHEKSYSEEYIKALYIVKLTQFIVWKIQPPTIDICVVGSDSFGASLVQISQNQGLSEHLRIQEKNLVSDYKNCEILYISRYAEFEASQILFKVSQLPILTVSDINRFIDQQGGIGFTDVGNSIKLEINYTTIKQQGILVDTEILEMAKRVL